MSYECVCYACVLCQYVRRYPLPLSMYGRVPVSLPLSGCIFQSLSLYVYVCMFCIADVSIQIHLYDLNQVTENSDSCSLWTDSLAIQRPDTRDDSEIQTSSCSADLMMIRTQNASFHASV